MYHLGVREELRQNIMCYRLPERFLSTKSSTQIPSTFKDFVAPYHHMLRQVTSDMQDNIQSGCNGHKFTDDVAKWCILNETVGQMQLSLSKLHIEPHPRADGPRKLPGQLPASIPLLPALYRDLCISLDDADFSLQLPERYSHMLRLNALNLRGWRCWKG